jgi:hypothetical protein
MRLALCRFCQHADRLASNGSPILVGLFNQVGMPDFPGKLDPCFVAIELEFDPVEADRSYPIHLLLIDEDGRPLARWSGVYQVDGPQIPTSFRSFLTIPFPWDRNLLIRRPGRFRLDVVVEAVPGQEVILGGEVLTISGPSG